jgi:DHA1 family bicyclomycin/chloramphenicol resistance-like MFS transporter
MRHFIDKASFSMKHETYLSLLMIIGPILNLSSGVTLTLYTASLPAMAGYFGTSIMAVKNLVSISLFGFAVGCIVFGIALDNVGRRVIILSALALYFIISLLAIFAHSIHEIILACFLLSMLTASTSIGARALIGDYFEGQRFQIGLLYTSLAYGMGSIIGPFIGAILQYNFGWKANFVGYAISSGLLFIVFALFVHESLVINSRFSWKNVAYDHYKILKNKMFLAGSFIGAVCQYHLMVYPAIGAFIVENVLHKGALSYGNSALLVSFGYMLGTLLSRLLVKRFPLHNLITLGFAIQLIGLTLMLIFGLLNLYSLSTLVLPIVLVTVSSGLIFMNVAGPCIKLFPKNIGVAMAILVCYAMVLSALGIFIISHFSTKDLVTVFWIFAVAGLIQFIVYQFGFKKSLISTTS